MMKCIFNNILIGLVIVGGIIGTYGKAFADVSIHSQLITRCASRISCYGEGCILYAPFTVVKHATFDSGANTYNLVGVQVGGGGEAQDDAVCSYKNNAFKKKGFFNLNDSTHTLGIATSVPNKWSGGGSGYWICDIWYPNQVSRYCPMTLRK